VGGRIAEGCERKKEKERKRKREREREREREEVCAAPANCRQGDGDTGKIELK